MNDQKETRFERTPDLVIEARPLVIVCENDYGEIEISTSRISADSDSVEHTNIVLPACDLDAVLSALIAIRERREGSLEA